jgi:ornithine cyclodeaminase
MDIRFIDKALIESLMPPPKCVELMDQAMRQVSLRECALPLRKGLPLMNGKGLLGWMPGYLRASDDGGGAYPDHFGIKLNSLYPDNPRHGFSSHLGLVVLYEADHGRPVAILDADVITSLRTAAASALATRELSRPESTTLAIIGTGEEARTHIPAMLAVRDIEEIKVWGRTPAHVEALCEEFSGLEEVAVEAAESVEAAVSGADVICTVTAADDPVLLGEWLPAGVHLNLVGSSIPEAREVDNEAVRRGRFYIDYIESTLNQAGELLRAIDDGVVDETHIVGEIGDVLLGKVPGRQSPDDITIYKSLGVAAQDLASARYLFDECERRGLGQVVVM